MTLAESMLDKSPLVPSTIDPFASAPRSHQSGLQYQYSSASAPLRYLLYPTIDCACRSTYSYVCVDIDQYRLRNVMEEHSELFTRQRPPSYDLIKRSTLDRNIVRIILPVDLVVQNPDYLGRAGYRGRVWRRAASQAAYLVWTKPCSRSQETSARRRSQSKNQGSCCGYSLRDNHARPLTNRGA